jgi:predicted DNA-binding transcriptional regulator AlpA
MSSVNDQSKPARRRRRATPEPPSSDAVQLLSPEQLAMRLLISRRTLRRWWAAGLLPAPVRLTAQSVGWLESDIREWLLSRKTSRRGAFGDNRIVG